MAVKTLEVPQPELQRIATANRDVVEIAASLNSLAADVQTKDAELAKRLREQVLRLLDRADTISTSVSTSLSTSIHAIPR